MFAQTEAAVLYENRHPNILQLFANFTITNTVPPCHCMVLELMKTDLQKRFIDNRPDAGSAANEEVREVLEQMGAALLVLHKANVAHRDVKPPNILWNGLLWKLADFGCAARGPAGR